MQTSLKRSSAHFWKEVKQNCPKSQGMDSRTSGASTGKDFEQGLSAMYSLAIDFFDEFGLERLTEPEKPLNEMSSDCK